MKNLTFAAALVFLVTLAAFAQPPTADDIRILQAEDERRYDATLAVMLTSPSPAVRTRAALAAGRIGDPAAVTELEVMMAGDDSPRAREMAAFALGEIESVDAADAVLRVLRNEKAPDGLRARTVEAAGKIAAANAKAPKAAELGTAILETLGTEVTRGAKSSRDVVLLGLTAALRARPDKTGWVAALFLVNPDARVRADAANTLSRVRATNANLTLRKMLATDRDPIARANAARALGAAEDKESLAQLIAAASADADSRVRVSAIRSLAALKDPAAADSLLKRGEVLLAGYKKAKKPRVIPAQQNEFLEIASALGRLLANTYNERAVNLFREFGKLDQGHSTEAYVARIRVAPGRGDNDVPELTHWRQYSTLAQVVAEFVDIEPKTEEARRMKGEAAGILRPMAVAFAESDPTSDAGTILAAPDVLRAYARFKTADLDEVLRKALTNKDPYIRTAAAELIAELPASPENLSALASALEYGRANDMDSNDAILAALDALFKLDKRRALSEMSFAARYPDQLVRLKVRSLLKDEAFRQSVSGDRPAQEFLKIVDSPQFVHVRSHSGKGTKVGQVLNAETDYRRALARRNGAVRAVLRTDKGTFTIELLPDDAPLTVDNFVKLAKSGYFNGLEVHRVVPNFVMQDGDPRGDGNGGPGWSIRCEINMVPFERGVVGMALSGKDTGGSQWFATHSPQPHLDGGYTVFGRVNETGMKVVDNIVRSDKILMLKIVEGPSPRKGTRGRKK